MGKKSKIAPKKGDFFLAERAGFEPAFPFGKHALQACALGQTTQPLHKNTRRFSPRRRAGLYYIFGQPQIAFASRLFCDFSEYIGTKSPKITKLHVPAFHLLAIIKVKLQYEDLMKIWVVFSTQFPPDACYF